MFSTRAHYLNGAPAQTEAVPTGIPAKTPDGEAATTAWEKILNKSGFSQISITTLPSTPPGPRAADTLLVGTVRLL